MRTFISIVLGLVLLLAGLFLAACNRVGRSPIASGKVTTPPSPPGPGYFEDVAANSGITFISRNGEEAGQATILESLGSGVGLLDYDGDGLLDIFLVGGGYFAGPDLKEIRGHPCKLYKNLGGFKFEDVTAAAGLDRLADGQP